MKYSGSCHCKKVKFTCDFELKQPSMCNCSYCKIRNAVHHIVDDIQIIEGKDDLHCYRFYTMKGEHYFCRHCGVYIYLKPPAPVFPFCINLCAVDNCDWQHLPINYFDGKSL